MSHCSICLCNFDGDDWEWSEGVCGSCNRHIKEGSGYNPHKKARCKKCRKIYSARDMDGNYKACPYC